jgi:hypothetical protein
MGGLSPEEKKTFGQAVNVLKGYATQAIAAKIEEINKKELEKNDYYTTNAAGEKILDYRVLKRRMIWAYNTCGMAISADPDIEWM